MNTKTARLLRRFKKLHYRSVKATWNTMTRAHKAKTRRGLKVELGDIEPKYSR